MATGPPSHSRTARDPLADTTKRIVNMPGHHGRKRSCAQDIRFNPPRVTTASATSQQRNSRHTETRNSHTTDEHASASTSLHNSTNGKGDRDTEKRSSQISTSSGASSSKRKTHIGPWQLGRTLGKGSAGRVRLARHHVTREQVAVKILPKNGQQMTQAGSLAAIDDWDRKQPGFAAEKRMPLSIEREVAILKLIDHPNIMKLWDIWENRSEM